jgi:hypothetical protein
MFDQWEEVVEKVKDKNMDEVNEKDLYELKQDTKEFVSEVGKDLKKAKEEQQKAEGMAPDMDTSSIAKAANTEDIVPNLEEKAEREVEKEEDQEKEEKEKN